jgi:hypothetical protein
MWTTTDNKTFKYPLKTAGNYGSCGGGFVGKET